jgi:Protein of unknown function (DUF2894)
VSVSASEPACAAEQALDALEARGGRAYDAPACDCVRALLSRADELGGGVGARLRQRAAAHLETLTRRFERDQQRLADALARSERDYGPQPELHKRLSRGDLSLVGRRLRRLRTLPITPGLARPAQATEAVAPARGRPTAQLSERRRRVLAYEDSVAEMVAALALARATDVVPSDAGPYNPLRIASEVLDRMRTVSPFYLAVQLNRLEELGSLLGLPELPAPPAAEKPRALQKPTGKSSARKPTRR